MPLRPSQTSDAPDVESHRLGFPRHLAVIMDGNNRWAKHKGLPGVEGHRAGEETVYRVVRYCAESKLEALTLFAFSSENWRRPAAEVDHLMGLFLETLGNRVDELDQQNIQVRFIGDLSAFSQPLQARMAAAVKKTAINSGMSLIIAVNYGGQWDILQATRRIAERVLAGDVNADAIDASLFKAMISLGDLPAVDLLVRTGGERRISNFLLWQLAYSELYFCDTLWPDVDQSTLDAAFFDYSSRQRRFGRSGEEVEQFEKEQLDK